jgi:hypothetical protein
MGLSKEEWAEMEEARERLYAELKIAADKRQLRAARYRREKVENFRKVDEILKHLKAERAQDE